MTGKTLSLFKIALGVIALAAAGGVWLIWDRAQAAQAAVRKFLQARAELQTVADATPAPSREVAAEIESDLARARKALAAMQAELRGHGPAGAALAAVKVPAARTDAFFDLATFVERSRAQARKQGIVLAPAAVHFGFSLHANEGPESALIEPVFRQRLVAQYLVEALFAARPRAILAIKRERPLTAAERKARAEATLAAAAAAADPTAQVAEVVPENNATISPDFFDLDPRLAAPNPDLVSVSAFRLVFTGQTAALRALLNQLATFELPVIVRTVEVDPALGEELTVAAEEAAAPAAALPAGGSIVLSATAAPKVVAAPKPPATPPIVAKSVSKFTVTVEFVELVPAPVAATASPTPSL